MALSCAATTTTLVLNELILINNIEDPTMQNHYLDTTSPAQFSYSWLTQDDLMDAQEPSIYAFPPFASSR